MIKIAIALSLLWQLAVILFQFWGPFRNKLGRLQFYLCGLLPTWRMFGPDPTDGDYQVYYRTAPEGMVDDAIFTEWRLVDYDLKPMLPFSLFFNPRGNIVKGLREICQEAIKASSDHNVFYQLLLNDLIRRYRQGQPAGTASTYLIQFQIRWQTPAALTPIFSSHAHPC
jgi:hypothetical protein